MLIFENGQFAWREGNLAGGKLVLQFDDGAISASEADWSCTDGIWSAGLINGLQLQFFIADDILHLSFQNAETKLFLKTITLEFAPTLEAGEYREYTHSRLFLEQCSGVKPVGLSTAMFEHNPPSYLAYLLAGKRYHLLFAALPPHAGDFLVFQAVHAEKSLRGKFGVRVTVEEDRDIFPEMKFQVSPILFRRSDGNPLEMLEKLGDRYADARKIPLKERVVGWNSWDQLRSDVTAADVLRNQREFESLSTHNPRYCIVDDGWQISYGAWTPNMKFPADLSAFCREIVDRGGVPGIWTAPLTVSRSSMFPRNWTVPLPSGQYLLDITVPEAAEYLRSIYCRLREAGFRYFKIDFTNGILGVDRLHDMRAGRAGILRRFYHLIREAIGEDSYFLGCCVPFEPAFGIVDAVRTTADIQIYWSSIQINMVSQSARWWMQHRLWNNDPDFLVVRGPETAEGRFTEETPYVCGRYASGPVLNRREAMTLALAVYMSAGDLIASDEFSKLNEAGKKILQDVFALPALRYAARPCDLFTAPTGECPAVWYAAEAGYLAIFNWSDDVRIFEIDPTRFGCTKTAGCFWNAKSFSDKVELAPHESIGLRLV